MNRDKEFMDLIFDIFDKDKTVEISAVFFSISRKDSLVSRREVMDELAMERSTYYRRRGAILLCGILLWDEVREKRFS